MKSVYLVILLSIFFLFPLLSVTGTDDERIETIIRAFRKLPAGEIEKYNVDLSDTKVELGSSRASALIAAWKIRQEELKEAMKSITKPAEIMVNITNQLNSRAFEYVSTRQLVEPAIIELLTNLESLLTDIDNARDFHSLGLWPTLVSFLHRGYSSSIRAKAAWAVGTTTKNSYEYQLWVLDFVRLNESGNSSEVTCLQLIMEMLDDSIDLSSRSNVTLENAVEFQKRTLYALSSALRGNLDVQQKILENYGESPYSSILSHLSGVSSANSSPQVVKKVITLLSDLLEEHEYIRYQLPQEIGLTQQTVSPTGEIIRILPTLRDSEEKKNDTASTNPMVYVGPLLGDIFFSSEAGPLLDSFTSVLREYLDKSQTRGLAEQALTLKEKNDWISIRDCLKNIFLIFRSLLLHKSRDEQYRLPQTTLSTLHTLLNDCDALKGGPFFDDIFGVVQQLREEITNDKLH